MLGVHKSTGITSIEQWLNSKTVVKLGGVGAGSATDDIPKFSPSRSACLCNWLAATRVLPMFASPLIAKKFWGLQFVGIVQSDVEQGA